MYRPMSGLSRRGRLRRWCRAPKLLRIAILAVLVTGAAVIGPTPEEPGTAPGAGIDVPQRGFALPTWQMNGYDGPNLEQTLREIKALGATWVQFTPTWYQRTRHSNAMFRTTETVSDTGVRRAVALAHRQGLKVFLKPHVDLPVPGQDSRNNIVPENRAAWFTAYTKFITHYAAMAQRLGVEQFAVGTELSSISSDRVAWLAVIKAVRAQYRGVLTYAAGRDWNSVPFWDALDLIGIDAYLPLGHAPTSNVRVLQRGWDSVLDEVAALSARFGNKVVFTEAGYTSQRGTITNPSSWRISKTADQAEQAAGYQALLNTFSGLPWWEGVYWWVWITPPDTDAEPLDFSPRGKIAERVIRQWWTT